MGTHSSLHARITHPPGWLPQALLCAFAVWVLGSTTLMILQLQPLPLYSDRHSVLVVSPNVSMRDGNASIGAKRERTDAVNSSAIPWAATHGSPTETPRSDAQRQPREVVAEEAGTGDAIPTPIPLRGDAAAASPSASSSASTSASASSSISTSTSRSSTSTVSASGSSSVSASPRLGDPGPAPPSTTASSSGSSSASPSAPPPPPNKQQCDPSGPQTCPDNAVSEPSADVSLRQSAPASSSGSASSSSSQSVQGVSSTASASSSASVSAAFDLDAVAVTGAYVRGRRPTLSGSPKPSPPRKRLRTPMLPHSSLSHSASASSSASASGGTSGQESSHAVAYVPSSSSVSGSLSASASLSPSLSVSSSVSSSASGSAISAFTSLSVSASQSASASLSSSVSSSGSASPSALSSPSTPASSSASRSASASPSSALSLGASASASMSASVSASLSPSASLTYSASATVSTPISGPGSIVLSSEDALRDPRVAPLEIQRFAPSPAPRLDGASRARSATRAAASPRTRSNPSRSASPSSTPALVNPCAFLGGRHAAVFFHSFPGENNGWARIFQDELNTLLGSPLTACGVPVFLGLPPGAAWPLTPDETPPFLSTLPRSRRSTARRYEEVHTLAALYEYCEAHTDAIVAYMHDKGTRKAFAPENYTQFQWDWRRLHEYFLIEVPQGCVGALADGAADMCGANWKHPNATKKNQISKRGPHYAGNFWWATCEHVAALRHPLDYDDFVGVDPEKDISAEMWITSPYRSESALGQRRSVGGPAWTAISCFHSGISNHHVKPYPRKKYEGVTCNEGAATRERWGPNGRFRRDSASGSEADDELGR